MPESDEGMQPKRKQETTRRDTWTTGIAPYNAHLPSLQSHFMLTGMYPLCILVGMSIDVLCIVMGVMTGTPGRVTRPAEATTGGREGQNPA